MQLYRPGHPRAHTNKYVFEHIVIMEQVLGRPMLEGETVHHKNGDKADNRPENLELWLRRQPYGQRVADRIADALAILRTYAPELLIDHLGGWGAARAEGSSQGGSAGS